MGYCLRSLVSSILILVALSACGVPQWPLQTEIRSEIKGVKVFKPQAGTNSFSASRAVIVKKGDSVYALSMRHAVSMRSIILANGLLPPFVLKIGQRIILPSEPVYRVRKGDSLSKIAESKDLSMYELVRLNALAPPYTIYAGQNLRLPERSPPEGFKNNASSSGQRIKIISVSPNIGKSIERKVAGAAPAPATKREKMPTWITVPKESVSKKPVISKTSQRSIIRSISKPAPRAGKRFMWPVKGRVISTFGTKSKGLRNDGINIAAPLGTPVLAAENGVVVYAGNELRGFGKLILIKHSGGWVSAYAHNSSFSVKRGDTVNKGQRIARVGSSGGVSMPQLHFELRKGRRAQDPRKHLKRA